MNFINQFGYSPDQIIQICELIITITKGKSNICEEAQITEE
jgi:hypothetical protein